MHTYLYTHAQPMYSHIYIRIQAHTHTCTMHIHPYMHTHAHPHTCSHTHAHTHTQTLRLYKTHPCTQVVFKFKIKEKFINHQFEYPQLPISFMCFNNSNKHNPINQLQISKPSKHTFTYYMCRLVLTHTYMYTNIYAHTHAVQHPYTCSHSRMHTNTYTHTVHIHMQIDNTHRYTQIIFKYKRKENFINNQFEHHPSPISFMCKINIIQ